MLDPEFLNGVCISKNGNGGMYQEFRVVRWLEPGDVQSYREVEGDECRIVVLVESGQQWQAACRCDGVLADLVTQTQMYMSFDWL